MIFDLMKTQSLAVTGGSQGIKEEKCIYDPQVTFYCGFESNDDGWKTFYFYSDK